jgi:MHS family shikimate/dehydroshikimate transporter-like MFS transporter
VSASSRDETGQNQQDAEASAAMGTGSKPMGVQDHQKTPANAAFASLIGGSIEWYDFYIYATAAALVFNQAFFPSYDPLVGTLLAFGTYAVGAIMRPLGGLIFGHFGDRLGRKAMLVWTLLAMGSATVLIGLLPTYGQIGIAAPILLLTLRSLQGIAFGGEWAGAALVAVEHAPDKKTGMFGSFAQMGSPIGLLMSTGTFSLLSFLSKDQFAAWGWRIPFVASALLVVVGLVVRLKLLESPAFQEIVSKGQVSSQPVADVLRNNFSTVAIACGVILCTVVAFHVEAVFLVSYATQSVGVPRQIVLNALLVTAAFQMFLLPVFACIGDIVGIRTMALFGAVMTGLCAFPFFWLVDLGTPLAITGGMCLGLIGIAALFSVLPSLISGMFQPRVRYSGMSIAYGIAAGVIGGLSPLLSGSLYVWAKASWPIALYLVFASAVSVVSILLIPDPAKVARRREAPLARATQPGA